MMRSGRGICLMVLAMLWFAPGLLAQRNNAKGDRYFDKNQFEEAIKYYTLESKGNGPSDEKNYARQQLAECYRILGRFEEAEKMYQRILKKKSNQKVADNYLKYGLSLKASAKYEEAKEQFRTYIEMAPEDPMGPLFLASCDSAQTWLDETLGLTATNVAALNTEATDMAPVFYDDQVVWTSSRKGTTKAFISFEAGIQVDRLDIWRADLHLINGDSLGKPKKLENINTPMHEGSATFSADGNEVYFTKTVKGEKDYRNKVIDRLQIYYSKRNADGTWTEPVSAFDFNSYKYSVGQPSLSADGKTLFFMSDKKGGKGETDIYYVQKDASGAWGEMVNCGDEVNTFGHELFPYISEDGVLYFSSDTHIGMGKLDIFSSSQKAGKWTNVLNLKPPYNSIGNDFAISFDNSGRRALFTSDRFNGVGSEDVYAFAFDAPIVLDIYANELRTADTRVFDGYKYRYQEGEGEEQVIEPQAGWNRLPLRNDEPYTLVAKNGFFPFDKVQVNMNYNPNNGSFQITTESEAHDYRLQGTMVTAGQDSVGGLTYTPVVNKKVVLLNPEGETVETVTTDQRGRFRLKTLLEPGMAYVVRTEG